MNFYTFLPKLLNMSLTASIAIVCVLLLRLFLKKAPKVISYCLWAVVLFRLLCPVSVSSDLSLFGLLDTPTVDGVAGTSSMEYVPENIVHTEFPEVTLPVPGISDTINSTLPQGEEQLVADPLEGPVFIGTYVWLLGVLVMVVYGVTSYVRLRRNLLVISPLQENIYLADDITTPFVMGLFRPRIYLPSDMEESQMPYIILHEKHHIRRGDHVMKVLAFIALSIHWFNPFVWVAFIYANKDMEMSCDEAVVKKMGDHILADYTASLLSLATGRTIIAGVPLAFGEGDTKGRIRNLAHWKKPAFWVVLAAVIAGVALSIGLLTNPAPKEVQKHTMEGYYLLIGAEGVESIEFSGTNASGGVANADGSTFKVGEKVWLEQLQGITDLRGIKIVALSAEGEILYMFSVPQGATAEEVAYKVGKDTWLLVPADFEVKDEIASEVAADIPKEEEIGLISENITVTGTPLEMAKEVVSKQFDQMRESEYINWQIDSLTREYIYETTKETPGDMRVKVYQLKYAFLAKNSEKLELSTYLCIVKDGGALSYVVIEENDCVPGEDAFTKGLEQLLGDFFSETAEDFYSMVTSASAEEVEQFAAGIKDDIMVKDWESLSQKLAYPIQIEGKVINNNDEFLQLDIDSRLSREFVDGIAAESCREMFFNYQGIMMGETGQVWIASVDNGAGEWELKVIALNGLIGHDVRD